ncbi:MAG: flagellar biosynthesis protein FlhF [Neptuniibacter caesariensis]|uniref:Flagellar biosynthesis protein FlhF n=1 Tax=Neptuniibacter caesariensis TaxID=207954 RepID=A0A2G6JM95_NEPCE|nr:MAG: flagellar biosynthesis protein FlhF [Neptuniibacter caesariensis]
MKVKRFFAPDMRQAMRRVRDEIGPDAVIVSNHRVAGGVEVVAAHDEDYDAAQREFSKNQAKTQRRQEQVSVLTGGQKDLNAELQKARLQIAEAQARQGPVSGFNSPTAVNKQIEQSDDELKAILTSLRERQKQKANQAHHNYMHGGLDGATLGLDLEEELSATAPAPEAAAGNQLIQSMQDEIAQLKQLLNQQVLAQAGPAETVKSPLQRKFELMGVGERLSRHLLLGMENNLPLDKAWKNALGRLSEAIPVMGEDFIERGGMVAFVGPTGVGKTTTIGKLAARHVLKYGSSSLALVTTDTYRIAAHEQLRTFGRILDVPVRIVDENNSLDDVLHSLRNKRLVLIDTAGLNAQEAHSQSQLEMLEAVTLRLKKILVVSCSSQRRVVEQAYNAYQRLGLTGCVLSKMDEAGSLGEAISLIVEKRLPVAYVTDGQRIPDDINVAQKNELVSRAVVTAQRGLEVEKQSVALDSIYKTG